MTQWGDQLTLLGERHRACHCPVQAVVQFIRQEHLLISNVVPARLNVLSYYLVHTADNWMIFKVKNVSGDTEEIVLHVLVQSGRT